MALPPAAEFYRFSLGDLASDVDLLRVIADRYLLQQGFAPFGASGSLPDAPTAGAAGESYRSTIRLVMRRRYHPEVTNGSGTAKDW